MSGKKRERENTGIEVEVDPFFVLVVNFTLDSDIFSFPIPSAHLGKMAKIGKESSVRSL